MRNRLPFAYRIAPIVRVLQKVVWACQGVARIADLMVTSILEDLDRAFAGCCDALGVAGYGRVAVAANALRATTTFMSQAHARPALSETVDLLRRAGAHRPRPTRTTGRTAAQPRISVVMAVYNAAPFLRDAVSSILAQTCDDFELIVVDDASTDSSVDVLESFSDSRIRFIAHPSHQGPSLSRNDAIAVARGEYVAIMEADDISSPRRLAAQVRFLDSHPDVGLVGCSIYDNIDVDGSVLYTSRLAEDNETIHEMLLEKWCFLHPSIMFRKEVIDRVGAYRSQFDPAEDHDFILRVLDHYKAENLSEKLVSYRINPRSLSVTSHGYINALGEMAMRAAQERRQGLDENLDGALQQVHRGRGQHPAGLLPRMLLWWGNSLYVSHRYYGFGCRELYAGHFQSARNCFARSLRSNCLFLRSWVCLSLSFFPLAVEKLRFVFRSSMQYHDDLKGRRRSSAA